MTKGFLSNLFTCLSDLYEVQRAHVWNLAFQNFSKQIGGLEQRESLRGGESSRVLRGRDFSFFEPSLRPVTVSNILFTFIYQHRGGEKMAADIPRRLECLQISRSVGYMYR